MVVSFPIVFLDLTRLTLSIFSMALDTPVFAVRGRLYKFPLVVKQLRIFQWLACLSGSFGLFQGGTFCTADGRNPLLTPSLSSRRVLCFVLPPFLFSEYTSFLINHCRPCWEAFGLFFHSSWFYLSDLSIPPFPLLDPLTAEAF